MQFFDQNMYSAHVHVYNMRLFFRQFCMIHGKELLCNVATVSYLTTLFLRASLKLPGGSLPVFSAHSFASNWQLALFESAEGWKTFHESMCRWLL